MKQGSMMTRIGVVAGVALSVLGLGDTAMADGPQSYDLEARQAAEMSAVGRIELGAAELRKRAFQLRTEGRADDADRVALEAYYLGGIAHRMMEDAIMGRGGPPLQAPADKP